MSRSKLSPGASRRSKRRAPTSSGPPVTLPPNSIPSSALANSTYYGGRNFSTHGSSDGADLPSQRALNAVKLERMFAKPFLGQLGNGHVQGVYSMCKDKNSLNCIASGSGDGVVKVWDLTTRDEETWRVAAQYVSITPSLV